MQAQQRGGPAETGPSVRREHAAGQRNGAAADTTSGCDAVAQQDRGLEGLHLVGWRGGGAASAVRLLHSEDQRAAQSGLLTAGQG